MTTTAVRSKQMHSALKQSFRTQALRSMTIISKESKEEYKKKNYTTRMNKTGRPVSPHVTVYAFPIGALSSITNRVTGCVLAVGVTGLSFAELVGGSGTALFLTQWVGSQGTLIAAGAKFGVSFPFVYHYGAAIRHFLWDYYPEMLGHANVERSSYYLFGGATAVCGALMFM